MYAVASFYMLTPAKKAPLLVKKDENKQPLINKLESDYKSDSKLNHDSILIEARSQYKFLTRILYICPQCDRFLTDDNIESEDFTNGRIMICPECNGVFVLDLFRFILSNYDELYEDTGFIWNAEVALKDKVKIIKIPLYYIKKIVGYHMGKFDRIVLNTNCINELIPYVYEKGVAQIIDSYLQVTNSNIHELFNITTRKCTDDESMTDVMFKYNICYPKLEFDNSNCDKLGFYSYHDTCDGDDDISDDDTDLQIDYITYKKQHKTDPFKLINYNEFWDLSIPIGSFNANKYNNIVPDDKLYTSCWIKCVDTTDSNKEHTFNLIYEYHR